MNKTTEQRVAETILEKGQTIQIGTKTYTVAPPTTATLIAVSELVAQMPAIKTDPNNIAAETLRIAKDCRILGDIIAVLILGERNLQQTRKTEKKRFFGLLIETKEETYDAKAELAKTILQETSPKQLNSALVALLQGMEIADFFGLSTSLIEINLLKETRGVEETTASGQR